MTSSWNMICLFHMTLKIWRVLPQLSGSDIHKTWMILVYLEYTLVKLVISRTPSSKHHDTLAKSVISLTPSSEHHDTMAKSVFCHDVDVLSPSDRSNWVMWQVKDPCPRPGWDGCLTRENSFHKKCKNLDNIAVYLITSLKSKWKNNK